MPQATSREKKGALQKRVKRARRVQEAKAAGLLAPAIAFLCFTFVLPIGYFLYRSVDNSVVPETLPRTVSILHDWKGTELPSERVYAALAHDIENTKQSKLFSLARRLNYQQPGFLPLLLKTANQLSTHVNGTPYKSTMIGIDDRWGENATWKLITHESSNVTRFFLLSAIGYSSTQQNNSTFPTTFERTFAISAIVTLLCILMGFPVAQLLVIAPQRVAEWLFLIVLLPFWISLLVRTLAWMIMLYHGGPVSDILTILGFTSGPISLLHTRFAVYVGMNQILLPFMILSIYSVMRGISDSYMKAAKSLGAHPIYAYCTVYIPQTLPGVGAGILLVLVLSLGFYITPMFLGGADDQMISYYIAFYTNENVNWGLAAALGTWLLLFAFGIFFILNRYFKVGASDVV